MESLTYQEDVQYYLIHNGDKTREYRMKYNFDVNGLDLKYVKWMLHPNSNELTHELIDEITISEPTNISGEIVMPGEYKLRRKSISCTYKHYLCIKDIVENNKKYGVIIEDNIDFIDNIPKTVDKYIDQLNTHYPDWDIIFDCEWLNINTRYIEGPVTPDRIVYPKTNEITSQCHGGTKSAAFYVVTYAGAKKLYDNYLPFAHNPDHWMNELFRKVGIKSFWAEPSIVKVQQNHTTTMER